MMRIKGYVLPAACALALACAAILPGCGPTVESGEVEQAANPVGEMHREVQQKLMAEGNRVQWYSYEDALIKARKEGKFVMVVFYASWCKWCKKFENETLTSQPVAEDIILNFVAAKLDGESSEKVVHEMRNIPAYELADSYGVENFPTTVFLEPDGKVAKPLVGYLDEKEFAQYLDYIKSGEYKNREF